MRVCHMYLSRNQLANAPHIGCNEIMHVSHASNPRHPMNTDLHNCQRALTDVEWNYDNSLTIHNLHNMVRMSTDPEQFKEFLHMLPASVLRDISASADSAEGKKAENERMKHEKNDVVKVLDHALRSQIRTANATLRLLQRFETAKDPDPDVVYVRKMVTASQKDMAEKQQSLWVAGILKEECDD